VAEERVLRRLAAIVSADVVGYSKMMGQDEAGTLARLKSLRSEFLHPKITEYGGRIVKTTGDGTLIEFGSAVDAVSHAVDVQRGLAERNADLPEEQQIHLRLGINVGDIIIDGDDIYGDGVNVAARLETAAEPDGICISARVHDYVGDRLDLAFEDIGQQSMKNIAEPVHVYRIRLGEHAPVTTVKLSGSPPLPDKPSIAVLPFQNMSGDLEQEYFSDGIAEDIITDLSKVSGLFVIARNSSFAYKGKSPDMRQVGRELGVRHLLEGSVRKAGDKVRINAQLIDTRNRGYLWAERYDGNLDDIFALQDEITAKIVSALKVSLTANERARGEAAPTKDMGAYDLFLRGRVAMFPPSADGNARASALLEQAIERDPEFADAYAHLGYAYFLASAFMWTEEAGNRKALEMTEKAVELNPGSACARARYGWISCANGDFERAVAELEHAIELDPNDADSYHWLAETMNYMGEPERGLELANTAMRFSPHLHGAVLAHSNYLLGRYDEAIATLYDAKVRAPGFPVNYAYLALVYTAIGREEDARAEIATLLNLVPRLTLKVWHERSPTYKIRAEIDRFDNAMRKAGLPER
jgi:adenylate cyclase